MSKLLTGALLLSGLSVAMFGCKRELTTYVEGQNPEVKFVASVEKQASSKLTPSDLVVGGAFEVADTVGLYLFDQRDGIAANGVYSYKNIPYIASDVEGKVLFAPMSGEGPVFYKTYYLHNVYAYYPYSVKNTSAASAQLINASVFTDQTSTKNYMLSDFLTCRLGDVKPQQILPAAPELAMNFNHRFTSVVVKIRNADESEILPLPEVSIINSFTQATVDITQSPVKFMGRTNPAPITLHHNAAYTNVNYVTELCYYGIAVPQAFVADKALLKVKIGTGVKARVFQYAPKATDPIYLAGGFVQGKEHEFEFVISGTELIVQGGEIQEWGTGNKSIDEINGEGKTAAKMFFEIKNATGDALTKMRRISSVDLTIDNKTRKTISYLFDESQSKVSCVYFQDNDWGYDVSSVVFKDLFGSTVMSCIPEKPIRIKGNPTAENYTTVIAVIDAVSGEITAK